MKFKKAITVGLGTIGALVIGGYMITGLASSFGTLPSETSAEQFKNSPQYNSEKGIFVNRRPNVIEEMRKKAMTISGIKDFIFAGDAQRVPANNLPEVKVDFEQFKKADQDFKVVWFGHSSLLLNLDGKTVLIDPVLSDTTGPLGFMMKRFQKAVTDLSELPPIDVIIISHDHYDHLDMDSVKFFKNKETKFIVPLGVAAHLVGWGISASRITELDWWQNSKIDGLEIIATPAQHFSGRGFFNQNKSLWASWVIRNEKHNIYFCADSGYDTHFKDIGEKYGPFDLAFIEDGQYNEKWREVHLLPEESIQAFYDLKAKRYFPIHWGMFNLALHAWYEPIENIAKFTAEKKIPLIAPKIGEVVTVNDNYVTNYWWSELISR
jgi:Predicted Zn-dependent hydrolases of the beta-lactamase fold